MTKRQQSCRSLFYYSFMLTFTTFLSSHTSTQARSRFVRPAIAFTATGSSINRQQQQRQTLPSLYLYTLLPSTRAYSKTRTNTNVLTSLSSRMISSVDSSTNRTKDTESESSSSERNSDSSSNVKDIRLLPFEDHTHNSVKITISENVLSSTNTPNRNLGPKNDDFKTRLEATIEACRCLHKSALWITVPMHHASTIEQMTHIPGLEFHHAVGQNAHLCLWLMDVHGIENKIPDYATHQVGVGSMVVNSRNELLCVRELRRNYRPWKLPGGLAEVGESIDEAAIREVKEETSIDCEFVSVLSFRHSHGMQFGRSDLYFVVRLRPVETDDGSGGKVVPKPVAQKNEIAEADWVKLDEYRKMVNDEERPHFMMQTILKLFDEENDIQRTVVNSVVPGRKPSPIYHAPLKKDQ